jgi:dienelactone hydrolase
LIASMLLVHGAGGGPWVFDGWRNMAHTVFACDLQRGVDPAVASMRDYADEVAACAHSLPRPLALCGWSMGGLVALMAAEHVRPDALVLIEPSPPAEAQENADAPLETGTFDAEAVYGTFPPGVAARPESMLARAERKRGVSVPSLPCRCLVVAGDEFPEERGTRVAHVYDAELRHFPGLSHWGLVRSAAVRDAVADWLAE